ncbi:TetR family transcriptional regulator [Alcaligenaceae bacterium]|nr:TetR family transcriptional regulator [Alcaligenaceae bacterium]
MKNSEAAVLWSPVLDMAAVRWKLRAQAALADFDLQDSVASLGRSGLLKMFSPKRQGGAMASFSAVVAVLETLAAPYPEAALLMASVQAGSYPILKQGNSQQKKAWLGCLASGHTLPPLFLSPENPLHGESAFPTTQHGSAIALHGRGRWVGAMAASNGVIVFTQKPGEHPARHISAYVLPKTVLELAGADTDTYEKGRCYGVLAFDIGLSSDMLVGGAGTAHEAMETSLGLYRIAVAAQAMGICLEAYNEALSVVRKYEDAAGSSRSALKLAYCAAAISSSRMALYEAARAADAGTDITSLSSMAVLSAHACTDSVINTGLQIVGDYPSADLARMQALLQARQLHRVGVGAPKEQAALLAEAILPPLKTIRPGTHLMSKPVRRRPAESPDRVSKILDAAADAFTQQSYDATTLDHIGDAIGVTKGSIYYHYRSKADLFVAVYRRAMEINIETVEPIARQAGSAAVDRLYRMAYAHSLQVMKNLSYQRVAVQGLESHLMSRATEEQRASLAEVISLRDRYEKLFVQIIKEAISAGDLPVQNPQLAVKPFFGAINWTTMWYQPRTGETPADRESIAAQLASFVVSGLKQSYEPAVSISMPALSAGEL